MAMKRLTLSAAVAMASLLLLSGCQGSSAPPTRPTPRATVEYTGQALQGEVFNLKGTPLYSMSKELRDKVQVDGAPFLLLASRDPQEALLVVVTDTTPEELMTRKSEVKDFSGVTETRDDAGLVSYIKNEFQLNLKTDDGGKLLILKVSSPPPATMPTPVASPSGDGQ